MVRKTKIRLLSLCEDRHTHVVASFVQTQPKAMICWDEKMGSPLPSLSLKHYSFSDLKICFQSISSHFFSGEKRFFTMPPFCHFQATFLILREQYRLLIEFTDICSWSETFLQEIKFMLAHLHTPEVQIYLENRISSRLNSFVLTKRCCFSIVDRCLLMQLLNSTVEFNTFSTKSVEKHSILLNSTLPTVEFVENPC